MEPTQITIGRGQGITQALKQLVEEKAKQNPNVKISDGIFTKTEWQNTIKVLDEIQASRKANNQASIFGKNYIVYENDKIDFTADEMSRIYNAMGVEVKEPQKKEKPSQPAVTAAPPENEPAEVPQDKKTKGTQQHTGESKTLETGLPTESIPHLETDKEGNRVNNYYDASGNLLRSEPVKDTETELNVQTQTLEPEIETFETGLPTESIPHLETDKGGNRVNNYYDASGNLLRSEPVKGSAPAVESQKPAADTAAPVVEGAKPAADTAAPVVEGAKPAADTAAPVVEGTKPAAEVTAPTVEDAKPAADTAAPVVEGAKPAAEVSKPADKVETSGDEQKPQQHTSDVDEYLKNDDNYQMHLEVYNTHKADFVRIGHQYNVKPGDFEDAKKKITNPDDLQAYINSVNKLYNERNSLTEYRKEMENWKDGPLNRRMLIRRSGEATGTGSNYTEVFRRNEFYVKHNNRVYTNVERITLKNGQHAWKSDQGVFYPWSNGKIGIDEVPAELVP